MPASAATWEFLAAGKPLRLDQFLAEQALQRDADLDMTFGEILEAGKLWQKTKEAISRPRMPARRVTTTRCSISTCGAATGSASIEGFTGCGDFREATMKICCTGGFGHESWVLSRTNPRPRLTSLAIFCLQKCT